MKTTIYDSLWWKTARYGRSSWAWYEYIGIRGDVPLPSPEFLACTSVAAPLAIIEVVAATMYRDTIALTILTSAVLVICLLALRCTGSAHNAMGLQKAHAAQGKKIWEELKRSFIEGRLESMDTRVVYKGKDGNFVSHTDFSFLRSSSLRNLLIVDDESLCVTSLTRAGDFLGWEEFRNGALLLASSPLESLPAIAASYDYDAPQTILASAVAGTVLSDLRVRDRIVLCSK